MGQNKPFLERKQDFTVERVWVIPVKSKKRYKLRKKGMIKNKETVLKAAGWGNFSAPLKGTAASCNTKSSRSVRKFVNYKFTKIK
jgi:hypothetical protein